MSNITENETWIDKLVDELVDTKDKVTDLNVKAIRLDVLAEIILNNTRLDYDGEGLRIENESAILEYLRVIRPSFYASKLKSLKDKREAEIQRLAEIKAKEAKGKEEA